MKQAHTHYGCNP